MNKCFFIGRITADVELRYTQDQMAVGSFTLAVDDGYGDKKHTSFLKHTVFGRKAENLGKYVSKGGKIAVESRARQGSWTDKEGNKRTSIGFIVDSWEFAEGKGDKNTNDNTPSEPVPESAPEQMGFDGFMSIPDGIDEELPFN